MRWIGGGTAIERGAVSASRMGRFETAFLASDRNLSVLNKLSGA